MKIPKKRGIFVSCFLLSLVSALPLEAGSVVRLGETIPRAILFGLGLFALWLAIWLLLFRVALAADRKIRGIADPVRRFWQELDAVIKVWILGSCAIILFILFPWVQGFAMPPCSVLMLKLFWVFCLAGGVTVVWTVLRLRKGLKAQRRAQLSSNEELHMVGEPRVGR